MTSAILASTILAISYPAASAETKYFSATLSADGYQNFTQLILQAESLAINTIDQGFREYPNLTELSVVIVGDRNGQQVPILLAKVSRTEWQQQPQIQNWSRYLPNSATLLGLVNQQSSQGLVANSGVNNYIKPKIEDDPGFRDD